MKLSLHKSFVSDDEGLPGDWLSPCSPFTGLSTGSEH